jgi:hypothetical protein
MGGNISFPTPDEQETLVNTRLNRRIHYLTNYDTLQKYKHTSAKLLLNEPSNKQPTREALHPTRRPFFYSPNQVWTSRAPKATP